MVAYRPHWLWMRLPEQNFEKNLLNVLLIFKIQISYCSQEIESMETLGEPTSSFGWLEPVDANPPWYIPKRKG